MKHRGASFLNVMLLAITSVWGTCSPAMRHAHEGGGSSHDSHPRVHHHSHHEHRDASKTRTACPWGHDDARANASDCAEHLHWVLLGFDLTLPVNQNGQDRERSSGSEPTIVRLVEEPVAVLVAAWQNSAADQAGVWACVPGAGAVVSASLRWVNPIAALPLCDSARFERSGVLQV